MDLETASRAASKAAAQIHAKINAKLIKRARKHGLTEAEGIALAETVKQAAVPTKRLRALCKGHGS